MREHYIKMLLRKTLIPTKLVCSANDLFSKLNLILFLFLIMPLAQAQCPSPPGDPAVFGNNSWIAYGYDTGDLSLTTAIYSGYYTQPTLGFDTQDSWSPTSAPSNSEGWSGCALNNDSFTLVYKRKGFPCGTYSVTIPSWDDAVVLYVDGVQLWSCATSSITGDCDAFTDEIELNEDSEVEVRLREDGGTSFTSFELTNNTPTIPGTLTPSGNTTICANTKPGAITLSGYSGSIVKWQSAEDAAFTTDVVDIASTAVVLTSLDMGTIAATRYYRAVVQNGSCLPQYPIPVEINVPLAVTYNGSWSSPPTETTPIIIDDDMLLVDDLTVCSCLVKGGKTLTIGEDVNLTLATSVNVETGAQLIIEDTGSLVQLEDSAVNTGSVQVKRNSKPMKTYDYTYWSSPVQGNTLFDLSPLTGSDKYYRFDPVINSWVSILNGAEEMEAGKGYIVRAPQGWSVSNATSGVYNAAFNGVPNNGVVPATIAKGTGTYNLIGNPYPSAIDIDAFLTDPANAGIVNGTVYLWTHNTAISASIPGNAVYNYTADDYAKYNLTGGVRTASSAITGGTIPLGVIASGQGFFIEAATELANGTYTVNFNNGMRIPGSNDNFYRMNSQHTSTPALEKNRLWITISNTQGAYNQTLLGYITNATNGADALFDGKPWAAGNVLSLYSVNGTDTYSIQGRALPFTSSDVVPLGYRTSIAGSFTLALEDFDGLFADQDVYLLDKTTNTMQNLKTGSYTFLSEIGTFNDRFEIRYTDSVLSVESPLADENVFVVYSHNGQLVVNAAVKMASVAVYDILGREIYHSGAINANDFKITPLNMKNQVLLLKAVLENGIVVGKKVIQE